MTYLKYPDEAMVDSYIAKKEPLLIAISFDGDKVLMYHNDDSFEHHILLTHFDIKQTDIDKYFRIVADERKAEWTFVCPRDYRGITDRQRRIKRFCNDGISAISEVLSDIGYFSNIIIPDRYRRHFDAMLDESTFLPY